MVKRDVEVIPCHKHETFKRALPPVDPAGKCFCHANCPCHPLEGASVCYCCREGLEAELYSGVPRVMEKARFAWDEADRKYKESKSKT